MEKFRVTQDTALLAQPDPNAPPLALVTRGTELGGRIVNFMFIETTVGDMHGFVFLGHAQPIAAGPVPIEGDDIDAFCIRVTDAARNAGADRDYLLAVAYALSGNLTDLGSAEGPDIGPFRMSEAEWNQAITGDGPAAGDGIQPDDRRDWARQATVAALLAAAEMERLARSLGRQPTFAELWFAQRVGSGAADALKLDRTTPSREAMDRIHATGAYATELRGLDPNPSLEDALSALEDRLASAYAAALPVIDRQEADIRFVRSTDGEPAWLRVAREEQLRGVKEFPGEASNERIEAYHAAAGLAGHRDGTAWCGSFAAFCVKAAGIALPGAPGLASSWKSWGERVIGPSPIGTVVVLSPQASGTSGHVGFLIEGSDDDRVVLLAGNQGSPGSVSAVSFDAGQVVERRWPTGVPLLKPPPTVPSSNGSPAQVPALSALGLDTLVRTVWGEARGEPREGQIAVVHVIRNRVARRGTNAETECLRKAQFACWWDRQQSQVRALSRAGKAYMDIEAVAKQAWNAPDITQGARHYYAPAGMANGQPPQWAKHGKVTRTIGRHIFLKDVP